MLYREWLLRQPNEDVAQAIEKATGAGELLCRVLAARGLNENEAAAMLGDAAPLPSPFGLKDMDKAVQRIHQAVQDEERIAVFGDYDVDGITATALVYTYLESLGAEVFYKLPSRNDEDYGLSPTLVDAMAERDITLVITVDNGTTAFDALKRARERGVSVVVTDHHLPYDTLPEVEALVNPCRADDESGLGNLSGAGVAFMLLAALEDCLPEELLPVFGDLAAIGTIADVMKLTGHNRTLVKGGMEALQHTERPGLQALIEACGWGDKGVTVENVSYGIAPRLNAAGRMDDATAALQLLLAEDEESAVELVAGLQQCNAARQKAEGEILELIAAQLEADTQLQRSRVLVIWGEGWHQGVIGIVASRLVDRYAKPVIVISFDENGEGRGSGRSFGGFSLHGAIAACDDILLRYGGHDLAAGLSIPRAKAEEFRRRVNQWAVQNSPVPTLPALWADAEVALPQLTVEAVAKLEALAPCGSGNPAPQFLIKNAVVEALYPVSEGKHTRLRLRQGGDTLYAVLFGTGPAQLAYQPGAAVDVLVSLSVYNGKQGPQVSVRVVEMRPAGMDNTHVQHGARFESFAAGGELDSDYRCAFNPSREEVAAVYRAIKAGGVFGSDLRPLFAALSPMAPGQVMCAVSALEELGLVERSAETGQLKLVPVAQKMDLMQSELLQKLAQ